MAKPDPHIRHINDTLVVLAATLQRPNSENVPTAVDLTGLTVEFKLVDKRTGQTVIEPTAVGVSVTNAAAGEVEFDFSSAVSSPGHYLAYFIVTDAGETGHFPVRPEMEVVIHGDY